MNDQFTVTLTGALLNGTTQEQALEAFAKLFKISAEDAAKTFAKAPVAIKKNTDEKTAQAFSRALTTAGVGHSIENAAVEEPAPVVAPVVIEAAVVEAPLVTEQPAVDAVESPVVIDDSVTPAAEPPVAEEAVVEAPVPASSHGPVGEVFASANPQGFAFKIEGKPDYAFLTVQLPANEALQVEASAMATMDSHIKMKTKLKGGFGRLLAGENIFLNEFTAQNIPGEVGIAPAAPGDLMHQYLDGNTLFLQSSAFVACGMGVTIETKWQGLTKGFFSSEGMFLIRCSGQGDLWFNTYGASIEIDVTDDYVVDTGNIVAFTEGLEYQITKVGGYKSLFFSGEGFVCRFTGKGKVWIQTRTPSALVSWANWFRPVKKKG